MPSNKFTNQHSDAATNGNSNLLHLIMTMQAMANQLGSMQQIMQKTQMTNSAIAKLLHNDIAN
jgi:hypothetical protein